MGKDSPPPADGIGDPERAAALAQARALEAEGWRALTAARDGLKVLLEPDGPPGQAPETGRLLAELWRLERAIQARRRAVRHFSQSGQDLWLDRHVFQGKRDGVFLDIGGYDGGTGNNTLFFELFQGWTGLLFEPVPIYHARAARVRRCPCHCVAIGAHEGQAEFRHVQRGNRERRRGPGASLPPDRERRKGVPVRPIAPFLQEAGIARVDYLSLDVEGSETEILESFPFAEVPVTALSVENTYGIAGIGAVLARHGYRRAATIGVDEIYLAS